MKRSVAEIIANAALAFDVTAAEIKGRSRFQDIAYARFATALIIRRERRLSYARIGRHLGNRDHSTMMYACTRADEMSRSDPEFADMLGRAAA